ncbi:hypothetical protein MKW94_018748, partial [Papaver nudicaule]|nr:hypothetical protein [Papaver nudicaule]
DAIVQNGSTSIVGQCIIQLARLQGVHSTNIIRDKYQIVIFKQMDTDIDGFVSVLELKTGLQKYSSQLVYSKVQMLSFHPLLGLMITKGSSPKCLHRSRCTLKSHHGSSKKSEKPNFPAINPK